MRFDNFKYSGCFIPATIKILNDLSSMIVKVVEIGNFKFGAYVFLSGVVRLWSTLHLSAFKYFNILLTYGCSFIILYFTIFLLAIIFVFFL